MKRAVVLMAVVLVLAGFASPRAQGSAETALRAAKETEVVKGDPAKALEQYERIAKEHKENRVVTAMSLVGQGRCFETLGRFAEARRAYRAILQEYSDQDDAAKEALRRIEMLPETKGSQVARGLAERAPGLLERVWTGPEVLNRTQAGRISNDGRYLPYVVTPFGRAGGVFVRDLQDGVDRELLHIADRSDGMADYQCIPSPDATRLAFAWIRPDRTEIRMIDMRKPGATATVLFRNDDVRYVLPQAWSPDGQQLAVALQRQDKVTSQIGLIDVGTGSLRVLKTMAWDGSFDNTMMAFSSDSRWLAYESRSGTKQRDIHLLAIDGTQHRTAVSDPADDRLIGWHRDGALFFSSDRAGTPGVWSVSVDSGRAGTARLVRANVDDLLRRVGLTAAGDLYYVRMPEWSSDLGVVDVGAPERQAGTPKLLPRIGVAVVGPLAWSHKGNAIAIRVQRGRLDNWDREVLVAIYDVDSDHVSVLRPKVDSVMRLSWLEDDSGLVIEGSDPEGRSGVFEFELKSGTVRRVSEVTVGTGSAPGISYVRRDDSSGLRLFARDISTGSEHEMTRGLSPADRRSAILVDDYLYFLSPATAFDPLRRTQYRLKRRDAAGLEEEMLDNVTGALLGAPRGSRVLTSRGDDTVMLSNRAGDRTVIGSRRPLAWAPDGQSFLAVESGSDAERGRTWWIPVTGGQPNALSLPILHEVRPAFDPTGRRLAFVSADAQSASGRVEVWKMQLPLQ